MQPEQTNQGRELNDESVLRYLTLNPEFFNNNQDLLPRLRIPHESGKAVSLIEKQVSVLRGKCGTLENSLRDLIAVARENENLHHRLHVLFQDIVSATSLEEIVALTRSSLRSNFNADEVHLFLLDKKPARKGSKKLSDKSSDSRKTIQASATRAAAARRRKLNANEGLTVVTSNDKRIKLFDDLFDSRETVCGLPTAEQMECFVGKDVSNIASAALIPLYHERQLGVIMLTSRDISRFSSSYGATATANKK